MGGFTPSMPVGYGPGPVNVPVTPGSKGKKVQTFQGDPSKPSIPSSLNAVQSSPAGPQVPPGAQGPDGPQYPPAAAKPDPGAQFLHTPLAQFIAGLNGSNANATGGYLQQFQSSLGAARSNIQQQLGAALSDIQNSQNAAGQALGQLPGQINQAYGQAQGTTQSALAAMQGAQQKSGLGSLMPVSAYMQPEMAALKNSQASAQANVPLLQEGIGEMGARERAQANMAALGDQSALSQLQAQGTLQAGLAQNNQGLSPRDQFMQQILLNNQSNDERMKEIKAQQNQPNTGAAAGAYGTNGLSQADVTSAHTSPQYSTFAQEISSGKIKSLADLQKALPGNPTLWRTLAVDFQLQ